MMVQWMKEPPVQMPSRHRSHIRRRGGRPNRRKPGSKSLRRLEGAQRFLPVRSTREASNSTGRSRCEPCKPRNTFPARSGWRGDWQSPRPSLLVEGRCRRRSAGYVQPTGSRGLSGRHVEKERHRKLGTTCGSPRRSRTAKASRISCWSAKSWCACKWGRWGRLSVDGPGHYNPDRSEDPWGRAASAARMVARRPSADLDFERGRPRGNGSREGRMQTEWREGNAGSGLSRAKAREGGV